MLYFFIQTEAEAAFAESDELKKACEAAEKAHEDLKQKTKVTEVFTRFLFSFCTHYFLSTLSHCLVTFIKKKKYWVIFCIVFAQIQVKELKGELITEKEKNKENTFQMDQLRKAIVHHE